MFFNLNRHKKDEIDVPVYNYHQLFVDKFIYLLDNSDVIYELLITKDSGFFIKNVDTLLFSDKELISSYAYKFIEPEKIKKGRNKINLKHRLQYMILITEALYHYLSEVVEKYQPIKDDCDVILETKIDFLNVVVECQKMIIDDPTVQKYYFNRYDNITDEQKKYSSLINSFEINSVKYVDDNNYTKEQTPNKFIVNIIANPLGILNDDSINDLLNTIYQLECGVNVFDHSNNIINNNKKLIKI